jgi:hypothetical protein
LSDVLIEMVEIPDEDGVIHLYHPETGEYAGPKSKWLPAEITGEDEFLQVMGAMAKNKAKLLAQKAMVDLIIKQQEKMLKRIQSQIDYLEVQYLNQIGRYVETALPRKADGTFRVKTLHCPYGSVAIRNTMPKIAVADDEAAVNYAKTHFPGAVKTKESVLVSQLPDDVRVSIFEEPSTSIMMGLQVIPGETKYVIKTVADDALETI